MRRAFKSLFKSPKKPPVWQVVRQGNRIISVCGCPLCQVFTNTEDIDHLHDEGLQVGTLGDLDQWSKQYCLLATRVCQTVNADADLSLYTSDSPLTIKIEAAQGHPRYKPALFTFKIETSNSSGFGGFSRTDISSYKFSHAIFVHAGEWVSGVSFSPPPNCDSSSQSAFNTARTWLKDCLESHDCCPKLSADRAILPTRVIDVRGDGDVKLVETHGKSGNYAILSYCWGKGQHLKTLKGNLEAHKQCISLRTLPQTVQDAVRVTRELGLEHLWVDALCIVQDLETEKAHEIDQMASTFKNASITISAALPDDSRLGFLSLPSKLSSLIDASIGLPVPLRNSGSEMLYGTVFVCPDPDCGFDIGTDDEDPIHKRAWVLQEDILSIRTLIYGSGPLRWRCLNGSYVEGRPGPTPPRPYSSEKPRDHLFIHDPTQLASWLQQDNNRDLLHEHWRDIVHNYSKRKLTFPEDKLPALAGIVSEFTRISHDTYLCGMWLKTLPVDLLWSQIPYYQDAEEPHPQLIANSNNPSWSWAAVNGAVMMRGTSNMPTQISIPRTYLDAPSTTVETQGKKWLQVIGRLRKITWAEIRGSFDVCSSISASDLYDTIIPDGSMTNPDFGGVDLDRDTRMQGLVQGFNYLNVGGLQARYIGPARRHIASVSASPGNAFGEDTGRVTNETASTQPGGIDREPEERLVAFDEEDFKEQGRDFWLLTITKDPRPRGLVLVHVGKDVFRRTGYFHARPSEGELNDDSDRSLTSMDWTDGLKLRKLMLV